jgi:pyridoxal phosphate enzyme (YggS family)
MRIEAACDSVGRDPEGVTLIAVTKTFPASDIRLLAELGVTDVGENRDQEASDKHAECADVPLRWHFVGQLQRNKARSVAHYADVVHSVDRLSLVTSLSAALTETSRELTALVQVNLDDDSEAADRGGVPPDLAPDLADAVALAAGLRLGGLMAVAPLGADADVAFARLARAAERVRLDHPEAVIVSAGMSGDLESAIRHGATHVRIGTALLGHRAAAVG